MNVKRLGRQLSAALRTPIAAAAFAAAFRERQTRRRALRRLGFWPEFGLCYNKIKKNANTSVVLLLDQASGAVAASRRDAKWRTSGLFDLPLRRLRELQQYHYFVVVRDPYSRVLSAFLDKFRHDAFRKKFGAFALDPDGFGQFLSWLRAGGLDKDAHWDLQTKLMVWPLEAYDTVIRFENFAPQMRALLDAQGIAIDPELLLDVLPADRDKKTSATQQLDRFYTPERRALVADLYRADFKALGYPE